MQLKDKNGSPQIAHKKVAGLAMLDEMPEYAQEFVRSGKGAGAVLIDLPKHVLATSNHIRKNKVLNCPMAYSTLTPTLTLTLSLTLPLTLTLTLTLTLLLPRLVLVLSLQLLFSLLLSLFLLLLLLLFPLLLLLLSLMLLIPCSVTPRSVTPPAHPANNVRQDRHPTFRGQKVMVFDISPQNSDCMTYIDTGTIFPSRYDIKLYMFRPGLRRDVYL